MARPARAIVPAPLLTSWESRWVRSHQPPSRSPRTKDQGSTHSVILELNKADIDTLGNVSGEAIHKNLAILLEGRVLSAPVVEAPITTSPLTLAFETASDAKQTATELRASATS